MQRATTYSRHELARYSSMNLRRDAYIDTESSLNSSIRADEVKCADLCGQLFRNPKITIDQITVIAGFRPGVEERYWLAWAERDTAQS